MRCSSGGTGAAGAARAGLPLRDYTDQYIKAFREDAAALGIEAVEDTPRATDPDNLKATCGSCHPKEVETAGFLTFDPHVNPHDEATLPQLRFIYFFMTVYRKGKV